MVIVPFAEQPTLAVLIVVYGGGELVPAAIESLVEHTAVSFEVVIVDNASPDGSYDLLRSSIEGAQILRQAENLGFGGGNNLAAATSSAPVLCLLNPDARVRPGWDRPLLERVGIPEVGAVAPVLLHEEGWIQEAGAVVDHWGMTAAPGHRDFSTPLVRPAGPRLADYATAACLVMRREVFLAVGGFDRVFHPAYYEDVDLCFRLWQSGYQVWCDPRSEVVHLGGGVRDPAASSELWHRNRSVFLARWRDELWPRPTLRGTQEDLDLLARWREPYHGVPQAPPSRTAAGPRRRIRGRDRRER